MRFASEKYLAPYQFPVYFREFSEGADRETIWHNSYEEEAVVGVSIDKENIEVVFEPHAPKNARPLKSALKSASSKVLQTNVQAGDDDMDITFLADICVDTVMRTSSAFRRPFLYKYTC